MLSRNTALGIRFSTLVFGCFFSLVSFARSTSGPEWLQLTDAYLSRHDSLIGKYANSSTQSVRLYAKALQNFAKRDLKALPNDGNACLAGSVKSNADVAAYFACLLVVRSGEAEDNKPKSAAIWQAKLMSFYNKHVSIIDQIGRSNDPAGIKTFHVPELTVIEKWPEQVVSVDRNWSDIPMSDGTVVAYVNDKPIRMLIDTGSTDIVLSKADIKRYALASTLIPLGASEVVGNNVGGFTSQLYYAKNFRVGPITVANAYVTIVPDAISKLPGSSIGMAQLSSLERFTISANKIGHFVESKKFRCGQMLFTRRPIAEGVARPFFEAPTGAGALGVYLDSGLHALGNEHDYDVHLMAKEMLKLASSPGVKSRKEINEMLMQGGRLVEYKTTRFVISIAGINVPGIFTHNNSSDPLLAGALDFNFLRKAAVAYDFPGRKMCIEPLQPALASKTLEKN